VATKYYDSGYACSMDEKGNINVRHKSAIVGFTYDEFGTFVKCLADFYLSKEVIDFGIAMRKEFAQRLLDPTDLEKIYPPAKEIKSEAAQTNNSPMDAIVRAAISVDAHWREFGPEHGFGEIMDRLYAVLQQQHQ
jgi:hypothetical protein